VPLSQSLPLRAERFKAKECRGFFAGILPEDSKREIIARNLGTSARIVSTVYYPELSRNMAMKIGTEYSSEKIVARDFEQLAEEAGLGRPLVRRRVPELADTAIASLEKVEVAHPIAEKVAALIRARCEKARQFS
jgi:hypothetical protein